MNTFAENKKGDKKIMDFNKKGFYSFTEDVNEALKSVAEKHGVSITCGTISYDDYHFTMKLNVVKNDGTTDGEKLLFEQECELYGFSKSDYRRTFTNGKKTFQLVGFNRRSPKNCCKIYCVTDGKIYKCGAEMVKWGFTKRQ